MPQKRVEQASSIADIRVPSNTRQTKVLEFDIAER